MFAELASAPTPMGVISLRRRREPTRGVNVYEVKLDDAFLMSSLFTVAEIELARLGLAACEGEDLNVVVGGLGLGYTAVAALEDDRVGSLAVVEALPEVIGWHESSLLPDAAALTADPRASMVHGDLFARLAAGDDLDPASPGRRHDAILIDIDHSPTNVLDPSHAGFYERPGLERLTDHLRPGGVFGLWSDDPPDERFLEVVRQVFDHAEAQVVTFPNFYTGDVSSNTVYVAR
jgi:spermidine synthase